MNRTLRACLTIAFTSLAFPALAAEPKPDFTIKTKSVEASVSLDAKIKANAALAADCLTEGKAWVAGYSTDADIERKHDPQMFRNGAWSVDRKYETRSVVDGHYVSIVRSDPPPTSASASAPSSPRPPMAGRP